jgi:hypothetical protein
VIFSMCLFAFGASAILLNLYSSHSNCIEFARYHVKHKYAHISGVIWRTKICMYIINSLNIISSLCVFCVPTVKHHAFIVIAY